MGSRKQSQSTEFTFPSPPVFLPVWALREGGDWAGLDEFSLLVKAEERTGKILELEYHDLPFGTWGVHIVRGRRGLIFINKRLSPYWRRFALFHELYHFLEHNGGMELWTRTATPLSSFEHQADLFAWGALRKEWGRCWAHAFP
jgi:hypothetical protein